MLKRLYHGSITLFEEIDLLQGKGYKDFGRGFYTTEVKDHAVRLAIRNKRIEENRLKEISGKTPLINVYIYEYEFDMDILNKFKSKIFTKADKEWALFVLSNRGSSTKAHTYDIVKGPTADDDTKVTLHTYRIGGYGDPKSERALKILIDLLEADNLPLQLYFGTNSAAKELIFKGVTKIK